MRLAATFVFAAAAAAWGLLAAVPPTPHSAAPAPHNAAPAPHNTASGAVSANVAAVSAAPAGAPSQQTPLAASLARGKKLYLAQCLTCHQIDGTGVMNMNPPLVKTTYVLGDKPTLIKIVLEGMKTPLTIDDNEYHNVMPPHTTMTDQEIADVLTYVRHSFGNKAAAVTAADVKAVRVKDGVK